VIAQLPVDVSTYLLNEKRDWVTTVEQRHDVSIVIVPNPDLETPNHEVRRVREDEIRLPENSAVSYKMAEREETETELPYAARKVVNQAAAPAVQGIIPQSPAPAKSKTPAAAARPGALVRFWRWLFGTPDKNKPARPKAGKKSPPKRTKKAGDARGKTGPAADRDAGKTPRKTKSGRPARKRKTAAASDKPRPEGAAPRGRSRGRRGGRRRRPGSDRARKDHSEGGPAGTEAKGIPGEPTARPPSDGQAGATMEKRDNRPAESQRPVAETGGNADRPAPVPRPDPVVSAPTPHSPAGDKPGEARTVWSSSPVDQPRGPGRDD